MPIFIIIIIVIRADLEDIIGDSDPQLVKILANHYADESIQSKGRVDLLAELPTEGTTAVTDMLLGSAAKTVTPNMYTVLPASSAPYTVRSNTGGGITNCRAV